MPRLQPAVQLDVRSDAAHDQHSGYELRDFAPYRGGMRKVHGQLRRMTEVSGHGGQHTPSSGTFDRSSMRAVRRTTSVPELLLAIGRERIDPGPAAVQDHSGSRGDSEAPVARR